MTQRFRWQERTKSCSFARSPFPASLSKKTFSMIRSLSLPMQETYSSYQ
nr:hypothetical protein X990_5628 [Burkholderia pseudomallei MSHR4868]